MKKIIRHVFLKTQCQFCGCEFAFEKSDIYNQVTADNKKIMPFTECPQCGKETPAQSHEVAEINYGMDAYYIANMQQQIDTFKAALLNINERINNGNKCNPVYTEPLDDNDRHFFNNIIRFIDQHAHAPEKNRTLEDIVAPAFKNDKAALEDYCSKMNDAAKKLGIDPLDCSVEEAIKICDEFDKTKAENQTTVFEFFPQIKQSNAINIVVKTPLDDFTTDQEAELNEDDLNDIPNVLAKNRKCGYVTVTPMNANNAFRKTFIEPNLNEKGFLRQDRFATELITEDGFLKYMLFFPWSKLDNQNAPYKQK